MERLLVTFLALAASCGTFKNQDELAQVAPREQVDEDGEFKVSAQDSDSIAPLIVRSVEVPTVTGVFLRGKSWAADVPDFPVPTGSGRQLQAIPFLELNQIIVEFSKPVFIQEGDLSLNGINVERYQVRDFQYDAAKFRARWTTTEDFVNERLVLTLHEERVADGIGLALDGEFTNPTEFGDETSSTFPSGDGEAGGKFVFRFQTLAGHARYTSSDELVTQSYPRDILTLVNHINSETPAAYDRSLDLNSDGEVSRLDATMAEFWLGSEMPPERD